MNILLHGERVDVFTAESHFIEWCLVLENEHNDVPHCALDANKMFQDAVYRYDMKARKVLNLAGIEIRW